MSNLLFRRIVIAKSLGFAIGLLSFVLIPMFLPDATLMFRFGVLLWYTLMGAFVGVFGVMDYHPILKMKINAWLRGIILGGSMNLTLILIAFGSLEVLMSTATIFNGASLFWGVLEGMIVAVVIDLVATKYAGEGPRLVTGS